MAVLRRHLKVIEFGCMKVKRVRKRPDRSVDKTPESECVGSCES